MKATRRFLLRGLLRGSAVAMALPFLDCFLDNNGKALAATGARIPTPLRHFLLGLWPDHGALSAQERQRRPRDTPQPTHRQSTYKNGINLLKAARLYR